MRKERPSILIADDHPLFLKGLEELINEETDWQVVGKARDGGEALDLIVRRSPDIAILDIDMPVKDGLEVAKQVYERRLSADVIILTMYDDELLIHRATSYGVKGFILKESAVDDILEGVEIVRKGGYFFSPQLKRPLTGRASGSLSNNPIPKNTLTKAELKVVELISEDQTSKEIAKTLHISLKTVENHRSNICKKLNLKGKNALLRYVLEHKKALRRMLSNN